MIRPFPLLACGFPERLEIRQRDLRFSAEEAAELFRLALSVSLLSELVSRLEERTEGWAAGLRMAAVALAQVEDPEAAAAAFVGSHELLVDYLLEEAVNKQSEEIQRFLLETSILPRFNEEGCVAITQNPQATNHLRAVDEANLFLVSLDHGHGSDPRARWFRYHHLFADSSSSGSGRPARSERTNSVTGPAAGSKPKGRFRKRWPRRRRWKIPGGEGTGS